MDLVFFCFTEKWWDWERGGFLGRSAMLARGFARHPLVRRMLVVDAPASFAAAAVRSSSRGVATARRLGEVREAAEDVYVLDQERLLPRERHAALPYAVNGLLHDRALIARIQHALERLRMERPVVWLSGPTVAKYAVPLDPSAIVYDAVDEWLSHPKYASIAPAIEDGYRLIRGEADLVFAVTPVLGQRFDDARPTVEVLPNGVDADAFSADCDEPERLRDVPHPRVTYLGVLEQRLDVGLLAEVAHRMPDVSFAMVGPVVDAGHLAPLRALPNVRLLGPCMPEEVPAFLKWSDACVMPHRDTELTRNMDPVKLHEYVASGRPVIASALPGISQPEHLVRRASGPGEWEARLREALSEDSRPDPTAVAEYVSANSWTGRVQTALETIEGLSSLPFAAATAGTRGWS